MKTDELKSIINYIIEKCVLLKNKYVSEQMGIDYICIFSQSESEYKELLKLTKSIGTIVDDTKTGPVFKFNNPPQTIAGKPKVLKIRIPDTTRPQRGDVDFNSNYKEFKQKYFDNKRLTLIKREKFEMLELRDDRFDVLVYFSSIPQSKLLGV